jgi:hypothetical protein
VPDLEQVGQDWLQQVDGNEHAAENLRFVIVGLAQHQRVHAEQLAILVGQRLTW